MDDADLSHAELTVPAPLTHDIPALVAAAQPDRALSPAVQADLAEWSLCHRDHLSLHPNGSRAGPVPPCDSLIL